MYEILIVCVTLNLKISDSVRQLMGITGLQGYDLMYHQLSLYFLFLLYIVACDPPCQNGGKCVDGKCSCTSKYTGAVCETRKMELYFF